MKTKLPLLLILSFALLFTIQKAKAQTLIHFWDFNSTYPFTGQGHDSLGTAFSYANSLTVDSGTGTWPLYPDYTSIPLAAAKIEYYRPQQLYSSRRDSIIDNGSGGAFYYDYSSTYYPYFTASDSSYSGGNMFIRTRNPSDSCQMYLYLPTTKYQNIQLDFAISASSTKGPDYLLFSYSTNGGSSWNNLTRAMDTFNISGVFMPDTLLANNDTTSLSLWYAVQLNFSSDPGVNNNPGFMVKFMLAGLTSKDTTGNARFDNFALLGDTDIATSVNEQKIAVGYNVYPNPADNNINIASANNNLKVLTIYDVLGQTISTVQTSGKLSSINISSLNSGVYLLNVKEVVSDKSYTFKLLKE